MEQSAEKKSSASCAISSPPNLTASRTRSASSSNSSHSKNSPEAALQFAEDRVPGRGEKDALEAAGIAYDPAARPWQRTDRAHPGANLLDAKAVARGLAEARAGRGR